MSQDLLSGDVDLEHTLCPQAAYMLTGESFI